MMLLKIRYFISVFLKASFTPFSKGDKLAQLDHVVMFYSAIYEYIFEK
jgi:hypothetical protein